MMWKEWLKQCLDTNDNDADNDHVSEWPEKFVLENGGGNATTIWKQLIKKSLVDVRLRNPNERKKKAIFKRASDETLERMRERERASFLKKRSKWQIYKFKFKIRIVKTKMRKVKKGRQTSIVRHSESGIKAEKTKPS